MATIVADKRVIVDDDELNEGDRETAWTGIRAGPDSAPLLTTTFSDGETVHKRPETHD